jgi:hypothetical protein
MGGDELSHRIQIAFFAGQPMRAARNEQQFFRLVRSGKYLAALFGGNEFIGVAVSDEDRALHAGDFARGFKAVCN